MTSTPTSGTPSVSRLLAEFQAKHGENFGTSSFSRMAVGSLTHKRFSAYMAEVHGITPPGWAGRNTIKLGAAKNCRSDQRYIHSRQSGSTGCQE